MSTIDNIKEIADQLLIDAIESDELMGTDTPGVFSYEVGGETVLVSQDDIDMANGEIAAQLVNDLGRDADHDTDADVIGNDLNNFIIGNDSANHLEGGLGDDQINTGAGDDIVDGGEGDDTIVLDLDDTGTKTLTGGEGNDTFIIEASGEESQTTITDFTAGDKLRWFADANDDGQIDVEDVDLENTTEVDGNTILTLVDGTTVVLEGVTGVFGGDLAFEFGVGDDDEPFVDITFVDM